MIEIIVGVWLTSLLLSVPITLWNFTSIRRRTESPEYATLNSNLLKVGQFWSLSNDSFVQLSESNPEADIKKLKRTYLMIAALGLLSVFGLIFLSILSFSIHVLAKSRLTQQVFHSPLANNIGLSADEVAKLVQGFYDHSSH
jgi:hypothetical protein